MRRRADTTRRREKATGLPRRALYLLAGLLAGGLIVAAGPAGAAAAATPGSLDTSFGTGGKVLTSLGVGGGAVTDAILQPNGDSVGVAKHDLDVQVQRFNTGGSLASASAAFDYSGAAGLDQARDSASAVAVQANGQALAAGSHFLATSVFGLARVNADGALDAGFGSAGTVTTSFNGDDGAGALLVQPDGKIIAVGFSENNATGQVFIALARYNA